MYVLLGLNNDTPEKEVIVYFVGVFDELLLAQNERNRLIAETKCDRNNYFIKTVTVNESYDYAWNCDDENEIK